MATQDRQEAGPPEEAGAHAQHRGLLCAIPKVWGALRGADPRDRTGADHERIRAGVAKMYGGIAEDPERGIGFNRGARYAATVLGYDKAELARVPESALRAFVGVGNPHLIDRLAQGETVVDLGCGAGTDLILAAAHVGPKGRAIGIDMTPAMIERCKKGLDDAEVVNAEVREGHLEDLPLDNGSVDVVISNGVLNLVPDKGRALREIVRVLRPGGRLLLSDIAMSGKLPGLVRNSIDLWSLCVGGALSEGQTLSLVGDAGLREARVTQRFDCAKGALSAPFARLIGVQGINLKAVKPIQA